MPECLVFIPSPLVGSETWAGVAAVMASAGHRCAIADLVDNGIGPYWPQHVEAVMRSPPADMHDAVMIAHSGAGPLLGALADELGARTRALIFVDAGLPNDGRTRLEMLRAEVGDTFADDLGRHLEEGGCYPEWSDADLAPSIRDADLRSSVLRSQRPRRLDFWTEPIPASAAWKDRPCAYLRLSKGYSVPCSTAAAFGWPVIQRSGGHFDIATKPGAVARDIEQLLYRLALATHR